MKKPPISEIIGWILIAAGIVIFGFVVYRSVSPRFAAEIKVTRPPRRPPPPPPPPIKKTKQVDALREYLKRLDTQTVDGFTAIESSSRSGSYDSWVGTSRSWWEYSDRPDQEVVWKTVPCPKEKRTTLVFSGVLGVAPGEARLYVNDKPILTFNTGAGPENEEWKQGDYELTFFALRIKPNRERLGIFCLTVPGEAVTAGQPVGLKVTGHKKTGGGNSFFMLSSIRDALKKLDLK